MRAEERPLDFWTEHIEDALRSYGGAARVTQVLTWIETHVALTERERLPVSGRSRPVFQLIVKGELHRLSQDGRLRRPAPGTYALP
jgi:hypothetical protein